MSNKRGQWAQTFGNFILAFSDYKNVTQNLGIKPTEQQRLQWESENADRIAQGKKARKTWKPTQQLGKFHEAYVGEKISAYHQVLPDTRALHTIELACEELKNKRYNWGQIKHLAKPLKDVIDRVQANASSYGTKHGHVYSRPPYGKLRPNCYHRYPCSIYVDNKTKRVTFKCNSEFNNKNKGEDKRCSFRQKGVEWERELATREDVAIEIDLEVGANRTEEPICVVGHAVL